MIINGKNYNTANTMPPKSVRKWLINELAPKVFKETMEYFKMDDCISDISYEQSLSSEALYFIIRFKDIDETIKISIRNHKPNTSCDYYIYISEYNTSEEVVKEFIKDINEFRSQFDVKERSKEISKLASMEEDNNGQFKEGLEPSNLRGNFNYRKKVADNINSILTGLRGNSNIEFSGYIFLIERLLTLATRDHYDIRQYTDKNSPTLMNRLRVDFYISGYHNDETLFYGIYNKGVMTLLVDINDVDKYIIDEGELSHGK